MFDPDFSARRVAPRYRPIESVGRSRTDLVEQMHTTAKPLVLVQQVDDRFLVALCEHAEFVS